MMIITYKALVFPVVRYSCESWTINKEECQRIDAFELWCWRRLLTVPWTARRSNQSILREINPEYSLEGLRSDANFDHLINLTVKGMREGPVLGAELTVIGKIKRTRVNAYLTY